MDTLRGPFNEDPAHEEDVAVDVLPVPIGRDERRMQVRAYNHWASLLDKHELPTIAQLDLTRLPDFAPSSVLIDFTGPDAAPWLSYIGQRLADQAGIDTTPRPMADIPAGTLLSRFTQHYAQIFANRAPIGFEAEFETPAGTTMLYRGILLPFAHDHHAITQILGVINWKERLDLFASEGLLSEMRSVLDQTPLVVEGPVGSLANPATPPGARARRWDWPSQDWGDQPWADGPGAEHAAAPWPNAPAPRLASLLAEARELAQAARHGSTRDHGALYAAIGAAHDLSLAADAVPDEAAALLTAFYLSPKPRTPWLPFVKLVFGADYDKTRLTEYATALTYARRIGLGRGMLARHLMETPGGLKAIIATQRLHRRADAPAADALPEVLAQALAQLAACDWDEVAQDGEIALAVVRGRDGEVEPLGRLAVNPVVIERLLRQFLAEQGA